MIKWIMMSLSAILFLQMSIFLISPKLFNKFADLFGEKTKINLKMNKLTYLIIGYFTSIYVFIKGFLYLASKKYNFRQRKIQHLPNLCSFLLPFHRFS